ncbi:RNaseH domain-containing protein [Streptomyces sp. NBC_01589]|uniref:RNaseH domain-containing protein n=1 Tax=unclassified Streptomyces TaxID=2593676 RepID=UPI0038661AF8
MQEWSGAARSRSFALLTHVLRQPSDYDQALALPLPLHLAGLAQEYVLPTPKGDETEEADRAAAEAVGRPAVRRIRTTGRTHRRWNSRCRTRSRRQRTPTLTGSCNCSTCDAWTGCWPHAQAGAIPGFRRPGGQACSAPDHPE